MVECTLSAFQLHERFVVRRLRSGELRADFGEFVQKRIDLVVKLAAALRNFLNVGLLLLLLPHVADGAQGGNQGAGGNEQNILAECFFLQPQEVLIQRHPGGLDRHEHEGVVCALAIQFGVVLFAQPFDVRRDTCRVRRSFLFNDGGVVGLCHPLVRRQAHLAIDDEHFIIGQVDEEIRSVQLARLVPL